MFYLDNVASWSAPEIRMRIVLKHWSSLKLREETREEEKERETHTHTHIGNISTW